MWMEVKGIVFSILVNLYYYIHTVDWNFSMSYFLSLTRQPQEHHPRMSKVTYHVNYTLFRTAPRILCYIFGFFNF